MNRVKARSGGTVGLRRDIPAVESRNCVPVPGRLQWGSCHCSRLTDRQRPSNRLCSISIDVFIGYFSVNMMLFILVFVIESKIVLHLLTLYSFLKLFCCGSYVNFPALV